MSKESLNNKDPEGFAAFLKYIYNPVTGQVLGRTGVSWAKVGIFYIIFYACLALFWSLMLWCFYATISYERPKWTLDESLIGTNPGLGFRPSPKVEKIDSTLIHFRPGKNESYHLWVKDLNDFLQPYRDFHNQRSDCSRNFPQRNDKCPFVVNPDDSPCGRNFGYDTGSPCVLIKLNRIFDWKPSPYRNVDDMKQSVRQNTKGVSNFNVNVKENEINKGEGQIFVQCEGENGSDKEKLGDIVYWPRQGFPAEYYPYTNQENYLSPFVLVQFNSPSRGQVINIECIAMDRSIEINKYDREGSVNYQLLIDN